MGKKGPRSKKGKSTEKKPSTSEKSPSCAAKGRKLPRSERSGIQKEWPPLKKCPQMTSGMITHFMRKLDFEDEELSNENVYYYSSEEEEEGKERNLYWYKPCDMKTFLHQVRDSRGYDVDITPPEFMYSPFMPVYPLHPDMFKWPIYQRQLGIATKMIIDHINSKTGKVYKYVETLKLVDSTNRILLLTFTAKEEDAADDAPLETFLAAVFAPERDVNGYELLECFLKPDGPAPTDGMIH